MRLENHKLLEKIQKIKDYLHWTLKQELVQLESEQKSLEEGNFG